MLNLNKLSEKTTIDNKDIQYLGKLDEFIAFLKDQTKNTKDPRVLMMRSEKNDELALYFFEGEMPKLEMPKLNFDDYIVR